MTDDQRKELDRILGPDWQAEVLQTAREVCRESINCDRDKSALAPAPWSYEPSGDSDGFTAGIDHFVLDWDGNQIACAPNARTGLCVAAAPEMLTALRAFVRMDDKGEEITGGEWNSAIVLARAAVAKAQGAVGTPQLTAEEEAEGQRLYSELLRDIERGDTWGLDPKADR